MNAPPPGPPLRPISFGRAPVRSPRPRFSRLDAWGMIGFTLASPLIASLLIGAHALRSPGIWIASLTSGALYALGWRLRDRMTAVFSAFLLATDAGFLEISARYPSAALAALVVTGALAAVVGVGTGVGSEDLRRQARASDLLSALTIAASIAAIASIMVRDGARSGHDGMALGLLSLYWLIIVYASDVRDSQRTRRGLFLSLGLLALTLAESFVRRPVLPAAAIDAVCTAMFGAGGARLLPLIAGDIPSPRSRTVWAICCGAALPLLRWLIGFAA